MEEINDPYLRHLFDDGSLLNVYNNEVINLSAGAPGPDLLQYCVEMIQKSTNHRLEEEKKENKYFLFQYGQTAGLWECRDELAKFLSKRYGDPVRREDLILTCGASHGLQTLLNSVLSPNGFIFVEEATYMIAIEAFRQFPFMKIVTVPMKDDVVDLDALDKIIAEMKQNGNFFHNEQKIFWAMYYTIPTFHNPTGMTLSPENCKRLVEIARKYSIMICCDDVYNLLYYGDGYPPHRLLFYDNPTDPDYKGGNIISNCSFSKIFSPAIRFGWLECPPRVTNILKKVGIMKSGGAVNHYVSGIIASLLHQNIQEQHVDRLVHIYKERMSALCDSLDRYLPRCCSYQRPEGGYFVWLHLPTGVDAAVFTTWCEKEYKVTAIPGSRFSYTGDCKNFLRLSIGFHNKETLENGAKILCKALLDYVRKAVY